MRWFFSLLLLGLLGLAQALSATGNRLLVVLEDLADKSKYSKFLGDLEGRGFKLTVDSIKSDDLALFHLGEKAYDHLLILPPRSKGLGPALTPQILLKFINSEGNILLTLSSANPAPIGIVSLLLELDIHLPTDRNSLLVDHFNFDTLSASEKHDVLLLPRPKSLRPDVVNFFKGEGKADELIAFPRGVGHTLGNERPLLAPVLRAPSTAYSYNPKDEADGVEDPFATGDQLALVSTMQGRNSARLTVVGSAEMLEDGWFDKKVKSSSGKEAKTVNREFAKEISGWTFNEVGVLKVGEIKHYLDESPDAHANATNSKIYRIKNKVTYTIEIGEWVWDRYVPFKVPEGDELQLEFSMLSPFHRLPLKVLETTQTSTIFTQTFTIPDQHGIFNFLVEYRRPFLSNIDEKNTVSIRHFAHNEWKRSYNISAAWPWMTGIGVTVVGWIAFVAIWLWSAPVPTAGVAKKTQ